MVLFVSAALSCCGFTGTIRIKGRNRHSPGLDILLVPLCQGSGLFGRQKIPAHGGKEIDQRALFQAEAAMLYAVLL